MMFVVLLKFSANKAAAAQHIAGHKSWLADGFDAGVFALAGSLQPSSGGAILAHGLTRAALETRLAADPFVAADVVSTEILEIAPSRHDARLDFIAA